MSTHSSDRDVWHAIVHTREPAKIALEKFPARMGRGASCEVLVVDSTVSEVHAVLRLEGGQLTITDEDSSNGSTLGRVPLRRGVPRIVVPGSQVKLGRVLVELQHAQPTLEGSTGEMALALVKKASAEVVVVEGPDLGKRFELRERVVVGRGAQCGFVLSDPSVSIEHVELALVAGELTVTDLGSRHGTRVGDETLRAKQHARWHPTDVMSFGQTVLSVLGLTVNNLVEMGSHAEEAPSPVISSPGPVVATPVRPSAKPREPTSRVIWFLLVAVLLLACATLGWLVFCSTTSS